LLVQSVQLWVQRWVRSFGQSALSRLLLGLSFLIGGPSASAAPPQHQMAGVVVAVADGDTVSLLDADKVLHRIRLLGIDAPEKKQPFGQRAKQHLSSLAFSKPARAVCGKTDRYGRQVCQVFVDGLDVGLAQVAGGMAWHYRQYERYQAGEDRWRYAEAEGGAREARRGLWQDAHPVPPWDFRREARQASAAVIN